MPPIVENQQLFSAVVANPAPDGPRRAYATWLRGHGDTYRADFIDLQLELAQKRREHRRVREWGPLSDQSDEFLKIGATAWSMGLAELIDKGIVTHVQFMRGFIEYLQIDAREFEKRANDLYAHAPILHLSLTDTNARPEVLGIAALGRLVSLDVSGQQLDDNAITVLAKSAHVKNLRWLDISANRITPVGLDAICSSPNLRQLQYVNCRGNRFDNPTDIAATEGEEVIQIDPSDPGVTLEKKFGPIAWIHSPSVFGAAYPPSMAVVEPN